MNEEVRMYVRAQAAFMFKPTPFFWLLGKEDRQSYLKNKRRWFRDYYEAITWVRKGRK